MTDPAKAPQPAPESGYDHSSDPNFTAYYQAASLSPRTIERFKSIRDKTLGLLSRGGAAGPFKVADIGCGAGAQCFLWAELGHVVQGLDVNGPLVEVARQRAADRGLSIRFDVGTATALPYESACVDVCLLPELLEHVADWQSCLNEAARIVRPGGVLFLSTTNWLCPVQQEFNLPLYSWYPGFIKRRYERLAVSTRPEIANYARYPAVHWFTFYGLRDYLEPFGFRCLDRFDMIDVSRAGTVGRIAVSAARALAPLRFIGHVLTEGTAIFALRTRG